MCGPRRSGCSRVWRRCSRRGRPGVSAVVGGRVGVGEGRVSGREVMRARRRWVKKMEGAEREERGARREGRGANSKE